MERPAGRLTFAHWRGGQSGDEGGGGRGVRGGKGGREKLGGSGGRQGTHVDCRAGGLDDGHEERELGRGISGRFISSLFGRSGGDVKGRELLPMVVRMERGRDDVPSRHRSICQ